MSFHITQSVKLPTCSLCLRWIGNTVQQVRGAKKVAKSSTITVKLLQDIPKFGPKGSILPVAPGRMRNLWFPRGMAKYLSAYDLKHIKDSDVMAERDVTFRPDLEEKKDRTLEMELLPDAQAVVALQNILPENLQFARSTIAGSKNAIHGSITAVDIATTIRAMAASAEGDASKVVLNAENIVFTKPLEGDKIRHLGTYAFEIRLKGAGETVRRNVVVTKQASAAENSQASG